ncbi:uncharacterized protein [Dermacentor albipictus]|uniref:uncharacterized protein n=1 Tax=Dermacentor albipictus TaxID=60249 RepID=UPI0038FC3F88
MSEHYSDCRTQIRRKLQGPAVPADIHQRHLPSWCGALQLLLGQVPQPTPQVPQPTPQVLQPTPQVPQPAPREPQAPRRQPRQQEREGAVVTATAKYVRQGQLVEARAQEEARFRQQMLEQNQQLCHHEAHMQSLRHLREAVAGMREVQPLHLEVARRSHEINERLLQLLLAALGHGGSQASPRSQAPHN